MQQNYYYSLLLALCFFSFYNCTPEEVGCSLVSRPKFNDAHLERAERWQMYRDTLSVKYASGYGHSFSLTGTLPEGITYSEEGRLLIFNGIPMESGSFEFKVGVSKEEANVSDPCVKHISKTFTLHVDDFQ